MLHNAAAFSVSAFAIVQRIKSAVALSAGTACQSFSACGGPRKLKDAYLKFARSLMGDKSEHWT